MEGGMTFHRKPEADEVFPRWGTVADHFKWSGWTSFRGHEDLRSSLGLEAILEAEGHKEVRKTTWTLWKEGRSLGLTGKDLRSFATVERTRWPSERVHRLFILEDGFAVVQTDFVGLDLSPRVTVYDGDGSPEGNKSALWAAVSLFSYLTEGAGADKGAVWKTARQALTGGEA